ncbi:MAG: DivIVA domain-containing protein [Bdellovibrionota bacterium]
MPVDIAHKSFSKKMMGIDQTEVETYLRQVAEHMEALIKEKNSLKEILREKEMQLLEYKEKDRTLRETISTATQMSERIRQDAERDAKLITNDAQTKADAITHDARESIRNIYNEINDLKKARLQFEANLKALAQAHLTLLEQGEKYLPPMHLPQHNFAAPAERTTEISPLATR